MPRSAIDLGAFVPVARWGCQYCPARDLTRETGPHTRMHSCPRFGGLTMPMVREGDRADVRVNEREDYVGREIVATADGRPVMSVTTEYPDGRTDVAVYAPTAHGEING